MHTQATTAVEETFGLAPGGGEGFAAFPGAPPAWDTSSQDFQHSRLNEAEPGFEHVQLKVQPLLALLPDWLFILRADGVLLGGHAPSESGCSQAPQRWAGKRLADLLPPALSEVAAGYLTRTLATQRTHAFACQHVVDGRVCDFQVRVTPHGLNQALVLVRDVSERKLLEKEILDISNREQMRIGQDLHDGLGQHLTGITFLTRALENKLAAQRLPEAAEAAEIGKLVLQALTQTRILARGLFPVELEAGGLAQAFKDVAATVEKCFNIRCQFLGDDAVRVTDRSLAHHLFRITQEAVSNAVRHGKAQCVSIALRRLDQKLLLSIRDDGIGFPSEETRPAGLGLRIMQYRAQRMRASLEIRAVETGGTLVQCVCHDPEAAGLSPAPPS